MKKLFSLFALMLGLTVLNQSNAVTLGELMNSVAKTKEVSSVEEASEVVIEKSAFDKVVDFLLVEHKKMTIATAVVIATSLVIYFTRDMTYGVKAGLNKALWQEMDEDGERILRFGPRHVVTGSKWVKDSAVAGYEWTADQATLGAYNAKENVVAGYNGAKNGVVDGYEWTADQATLGAYNAKKNVVAGSKWVKGKADKGYTWTAGKARAGYDATTTFVSGHKVETAIGTVAFVSIALVVWDLMRDQDASFLRSNAVDSVEKTKDMAFNVYKKYLNSDSDSLLPDFLG